MVVGLGIDLVELDRLKAALARQGSPLLARLFTERELALLGDDTRGLRIQRIGARFAAKEAMLKALGTGWGRGIGWHDVEVLGGRGEPPTLAVHGAARRRMEALGASRAHLSLSHTATSACATVVLD